MADDVANVFLRVLAQLQDSLLVCPRARSSPTGWDEGKEVKIRRSAVCKQRQRRLQSGDLTYSGIRWARPCERLVDSSHLRLTQRLAFRTITVRLYRRRR